MAAVSLYWDTNMADVTSRVLTHDVTSAILGFIERLKALYEVRSCHKISCYLLRKLKYLTYPQQSVLQCDFSPFCV